MGLRAKRKDIDLKGANFRVEKHMVTDGPRMIDKLVVSLHLPAHIAEDQRKKFEALVDKCPVALSLHPSVGVELTISYDA